MLVRRSNQGGTERVAEARARLLGRHKATAANREENEMHDESAPDSPRGPEVPVPVEDADELRRRCREERDTLTPHETADCAGAEYVERYENEEDGGT